MGDDTIEQLLPDATSVLSEFIDQFVESHADFDPLNSWLTDLTNVDGLELLKKSSTPQKMLLIELTFSNVLADLIKLRDSDNGYNYKQIALLCDASFYLKSIDVSRFDLPYILIQIIISELPVNWLLHFWSYLEFRTEQVKMLTPEQKLQPTKSNGVNLIITLNLKLRELRKNNEPRRDLLRDKVLMFTTQIFPIYDRCFINRTFQQNFDTEAEHKINRDEKGAFFTFWEMQEYFQDPIGYVASYPRADGLKLHLNDALDLVRRVEEKLKGPMSTPGAHGSHRKSFPRFDNTLERYERQDLSAEQRSELLALSNKDFSPLFFIDKDKFPDQLENDASLRKIFLIQMYIAAVHINHVLHGRLVRSAVTRKIDDFQQKCGKGQKYGFFKELSNSIRRVIQHFYPALMRTLRIFEIHQLHHFNQILQNYSGFNVLFEKLVLDDVFRESYKKRFTIKPRFWAKYGTSEISRHWTIKTGLDLLRKDGSEESVQCSENDMRRHTQGNDLETWKALRVAKRNQLFKFDQVNDNTGLEGLYDDNLKKQFDEKIAQQEAENETLFTKLEEADSQREAEASDLKTQLELKKAEDGARRKELEAVRREEELRRELSKSRETSADVKGGESSPDEDDLIEKKRKASAELPDSQAKRARLGSSRGTTTATSSAGNDIDLDY